MQIRAQKTAGPFPRPYAKMHAWGPHHVIARSFLFRVWNGGPTPPPMLTSLGLLPLYLLIAVVWIGLIVLFLIMPWDPTLEGVGLGVMVGLTMGAWCWTGCRSR